MNTFTEELTAKDNFLEQIKTEEVNKKEDFSEFFSEDSKGENFEEQLLSEIEENNLNKEFRAILNIYVTKNNVIAGLYDALDQHKLVSGGKDSGGNYTKRGTDKNSAKVMQQLLDTYDNYIKELGIDHLTINLIKGKATKKSISAEKNISNLLNYWRLENVQKYPELITNKSRKPHGKPNRRKGSRRGRRV